MNEEYGLTPYETREILFYKTDNGEVRVEILLYQENLWLTQAKMAELFEVQKAAISKHLKNIFTSGELQEEAVVSKMETTASSVSSPDSKIFFRCFEMTASSFAFFQIFICNICRTVVPELRFVIEKHFRCV